MVAAVRGALVLGLLLAGCYQPSAGDCQVLCAADRACPGGATCGADGYCHGAGGAASCGPGPDAPLPDALDVDAAPAQGGATLAAGTGHACAIRDGHLWCWGDNRRGQLGVSGDRRSATPVEVTPGVSTWTAVAAGRLHTCGVRDGGVQCWGAADAGQNGQLTDTAIPQAVTRADASTLTGARAVCAGSNHACAIVDDGAHLACWGANTKGQLGNANTAFGRFATVVTAPADGERWTALACGDEHTCALRGGRAYCWGDPASGRLGRATGATNVPGPALTGLTAPTALAAGSAFTCALDGGALRCWGDNDGALGATPQPRAVPGIAGALTLVSASRRGLCVSDGASAACIGIDGDGERGDGSFVYRNEFGAVVGLTGVVELAAGAGFHCARTAVDVRCWGKNSHGQLGGGQHATGFVPRVVPGSWRGVAAGANKTCAIDDTDHVQCWGDNRRGQLVPGDGRAVIDTPTTVLSVGTATRVALAADHGCAITTTGAVACWGDNAYGRVGNGLSAAGSYPAMAIATGGQPLTGATALAVGDHGTCASAVPSGGVATLLCWGDNDGHRIAGPDPAMDYPTPMAVDASAWGGLALGGDFGCGFRGPGAATLCWGLGADGQQGTGDGADHASPLPVAGGPVFTSLAAASLGAHACGVSVGGQVLCWGRNTNHQVRGVATPRILQPTAVDAATDWAEVATGTATTCARKTTGALYCWGRNDADFQEAGLDLDSGFDLAVPTLVGSGFTAVSVGDTHACGLAGTQLSCWGASPFGAAGLPGARNAALPTRVSLP